MVRKEKPCIKIPITILTKKIPSRQNSIFYAGKDIASVMIGTRSYVLTTAGQYIFDYTNLKGDTVRGDETSKIVSQLTDHKIRQMGFNDSIHNWGWFGINVWYTDATGRTQCLGVPTDAYTNYDEAMDAFISYVEKDITL